MAIEDYSRFGFYTDDYSKFLGYDPREYGVGGGGQKPRPGGGPIEQYQLWGGLDPYTESSTLDQLDPEYYGPIEDPYEYLYESGWTGLDKDLDYLQPYENFMYEPEIDYGEEVTQSRDAWLSQGIMPYTGQITPIESLEYDIQGSKESADLLKETRLGTVESTMEGQIAGLGGLGEFGEAGTEDYNVFGGGTGRAGELQSVYEQQLLQGSQRRGEAITTMEQQKEDLQETQRDIQAKQRQGLAPIAEAGGLAAVDTGYGARVERQQRQLERGEVTVEEELQDVLGEYGRQEEEYEAELAEVEGLETAATSDFELNLQNLGFAQDEESGDWSLPEASEAAEGTDLSDYYSAYQDIRTVEDADYKDKLDNLNSQYRSALNQGDNLEAHNIEKAKKTLTDKHIDYTTKLDEDAAALRDTDEGSMERIFFELPEAREERLAEESAQALCESSGGVWDGIGGCYGAGTEYDYEYYGSGGGV
jgi:hypothetical protein